MSLRLVTPFINTVTPGSYPNVTVQSNPVGLGASGIVVIIGEAEGGDSYQNVLLKNNGFTTDQLDKVQHLYTSGQIVDAFSALAAPSADPEISSSANLIYIVKTNSGTKASRVMPTSYGTLSYKNWGIAGNKYKFVVTETQAEVAPSIGGNTIAALGAPLNGLSFQIRLNGGVSTTITLSGISTNHDTIPNLVSELNSLLPVGITASAGTAPSSIKLEINVDSSANQKGWGKSIELIDSVPGDLAAIGLSAGLQISSSEPAVEVKVSRPDISFSETLDMSADIALNIGYQGTTATVTINSTTLTTSVIGGTGAGLSIKLSDHVTIGDLAAFINSQTGYSASAVPAAQQKSPTALDYVAGVGICSTESNLKPGRIKNAASSFNSSMNTSTALEFSLTATAGLPDGMSAYLYLENGARGATSAADIVNALEQLSSVQCNIIVPLFSQDASSDIAEGLTDNSSTYTIAAINAATKNHCLQYSTPKLKKNRICILSFNGTYIDAKEQAQSLANYRCSLAVQKVKQVNSQGAIATFQPWYQACLAAGMQAGGFYKAIVNKAANIVSYIDPTGFDSGSPGDVEDALTGGLLFFSQDVGRAGYWVSDQTTYGFDTNFVYNSIQAVYCSDLIALDLAQSFFTAIVGKSQSDVDAGVGLALLAQKMFGYKGLKLIAASSDAPLGYRNQKVVVSGTTMTVSVEIKLAGAIYFVPININISQVQNSAE